MMDKYISSLLDQQAVLREKIIIYSYEKIIGIARLVAYSPPRSAQMVRLLSSLKEKIEELDKI